MNKTILAVSVARLRARAKVGLYPRPHRPLRPPLPPPRHPHPHPH
jgi:hypothetical protein